jgi:hypothetical protein
MNEQEMFAKEAELVTEEFVKNSNTYNDGTASHKERCKRGAEKSNGLKTYNEDCGYRCFGNCFG